MLLKLLSYVLGSRSVPTRRAVVKARPTLVCNTGVQSSTYKAEVAKEFSESPSIQS